MRATLVNRVRQLLVGVADDDAQGFTGSERRRSPAQQPEVQTSRVHHRINQLDEQGSSSIMAGCVQLVGLNEVKARLGSQWLKSAGEALLLAEQVLSEHLGPERE